VSSRLRRIPSEWLAFAVVLAVYLVYLPLSGYDKLYFDGQRYLDLSRSFTHHGHFSLYGYVDPQRGYGYPLLLRELRAVTSPFGLGVENTTKGLNALVVALLGAVLMPTLAKRIFPGLRITVPRILAFNALLFVFWRDFLNFPLTDFPAITLVCGALLLALQPRWYLLALSGLAAGIALNFRPAYLLLSVLLVPFAAYNFARGRPSRRLRHALVAAALVVVGIGVALAPQAAINHHTYHSLSPFPKGTHDLEGLQFTGGLQLQKYETTIDPTSSPSVFFPDRKTQALLYEGGRTHVSSTAGYLDIVVSHPIAMASAYLRRLFNGLDIEYPSPYVRNIVGDRSWLRSLLLYSLIFVALNVILRASLRRRLGHIDWLLGVLWLLPAATAVSSAVEVRFFLPLTLLIWALVCFSDGLPASFRALGRPQKVVLIGVYCVFAIACFAMADSTYSLVSTTSIAG
jgi:hypothetical protein